MNSIREVFRAVTSISMLIVVTAPVGAQERYSPFVPTEESDVVRMLRLADLREGDVVFDLGSGDGRIVLEAVRMKAGVRGRGIEMDEKLIEESMATAQATGLADRVQFVHQNAFDADLQDATVITMWLWPEVMHMLRPKILAQAKPGTRVITRMWDLGTWPPDESTTEGTTLYKWIVPARIGGYWSWNLTVGDRKLPYSAIFEQRFQTVEGAARVANRRALLNDVKLSGQDISFSILISVEGAKLMRHQFSGKVRGDIIEGSVSVLREPYEHAVEIPWRAERTAASAYLDPTGMDSEVGR
ncbi:MAG: SAM-dependent methyltransferase [Burkholderiales bacterium]